MKACWENRKHVLCLKGNVNTSTNTLPDIIKKFHLHTHSSSEERFVIQTQREEDVLT